MNKKLKRAVYAGSFDPLTVGHLDIIARASVLFDEVYVCVMVNVNKHYLFSEEQRLEMLMSVLKAYPNVHADVFQGLVTDYARFREADFLIKGLRSGTDFDYENNIEYYNRRMAPHLETVYLSASPEYRYISSSSVKELLVFGGDIGGLVPAETELMIKNIICQDRK